LYLLRALHQGFQHYGGCYLPDHKVLRIDRDGDVFSVETGKKSLQAPKIVLAAGNGSVELAAMLGVQIPIRPERGQTLVTERVRPVLPIAMSTIRQTAEGSFMLGQSNEDVGFDVQTTTEITQMLARRAVNSFPDLAKVNLVRCWGGLRVLSPDKMPVYFEFDNSPGAYMVTSHSGVSLCSLHATHIPRWVVEGKTPDGFESFDLRRFDVQEN
jgi:glycine/D-amino acid oxidase-like deaminating enzyme